MSELFPLAIAMAEPKSFHMTAEEFRRHGKEVIDWIADYYERLGSLPMSIV